MIRAGSLQLQESLLEGIKTVKVRRKECVIIKSEVGVMLFEHRGRGQEARNAGDV